jgi:hypothetical protein
MRAEFYHDSRYAGGEIHLHPSRFATLGGAFYRILAKYLAGA